MNYNIYLDIQRCSGCQACIVACMDQHDFLEAEKEEARRQIFYVESGLFPEAKIKYVSLACRHCQEASCVEVCPTGAVYKNCETGIVIVQQDVCIGCRNCSSACSLGIPRFDSDGKMEKCDMCSDRIQYGFDPACVHTCPTKALRYGGSTEENQQIEAELVAMALKISKDILTK